MNLIIFSLKEKWEFEGGLLAGNLFIGSIINLEGAVCAQDTPRVSEKRSICNESRRNKGGMGQVSEEKQHSSGPDSSALWLSLAAPAVSSVTRSPWQGRQCALCSLALTTSAAILLPLLPHILPAQAAAEAAQVSISPLLKLIKGWKGRSWCQFLPP